MKKNHLSRIPISISTDDNGNGNGGKGGSYYQIGGNYGKQTKRSTETRESVEINQNVQSMTSVEPGDTF